MLLYLVGAIKMIRVSHFGSLRKYHAKVSIPHVKFVNLCPVRSYLKYLSLLTHKIFHYCSCLDYLRDGICSRYFLFLPSVVWLLVLSTVGMVLFLVTLWFLYRFFERREVCVCMCMYDYHIAARL